MNVLGNNKGFTALEMVFVLTIMGILIIGMTFIWVGTLNVLQSTGIQNYAAVDADIALQSMVNDMREAEQYTIQPGNTSILLTYPTVTANGSFNITDVNPNNTITYYLSDATGATNKAGTCLWRNDNGALQLIRSDISSLTFATDTSFAGIKVSVKATRYSFLDTKTIAYSSIVVLMRNYI